MVRLDLYLIRTFFRSQTRTLWPDMAPALKQKDWDYLYSEMESSGAKEYTTAYHLAIFWLQCSFLKLGWTDLHVKRQFHAIHGDGKCILTHCWRRS